MTILIIGTAEEVHSAHMAHHLRQAGGDVVYFDTRRFPKDAKLALIPGDLSASTYWEPDSGRTLSLAEIRSVYWRYFMGLESTEDASPFLKEMAIQEIQSTVGSLFRNLDCLWVNSPQAIELHYYKPHQLQLLQEAGIRVPRTLITNDADAVQAFYEATPGGVIFKPVNGGAHTQALQPEHFQPEKLAELRKAPVQFQEMIPGIDIRVYVVGDSLFAAEIHSTTLDFREDPQAVLKPITLPDTVARDCFTVAHTLGLVFSGIDIRRTPNGEHVFLEGNPSPMFMHVENVTGHPITAALVSTLLTPQR